MEFQYNEWGDKIFKEVKTQFSKANLFKEYELDEKDDVVTDSNGKAKYGKTKIFIALYGDDQTEDCPELDFWLTFEGMKEKDITSFFRNKMNLTESECHSDGYIKIESSSRDMNEQDLQFVIETLKQKEIEYKKELSSELEDDDEYWEGMEEERATLRKYLSTITLQNPA